MQTELKLQEGKQLDSYSILICAKYFKTTQDYINIICVCQKFKETTEKLRYNPIPIKSLKLFPKMETQYLYTKNTKRIKGIKRWEIWYSVTYKKYLKFKKDGIKCHDVAYTENDRTNYGNEIPDGVTRLGASFLIFDVLDSITIPSHVTSMEVCNFDGYKLSSVVLSNGISKIGDNTFDECSQLKEIVIPQTVWSLGKECLGDVVL
ncbi:Leucine rich repeat containing protein BspA family protein [Entamoeba marina]